MSKKIVSLTIVILILSLAFAPFVSATVYEMSHMDDTHDMGAATQVTQCAGMTLVPSTSLFMWSASFYLQRTGSPTGTFTVGVYNHTDHTSLENSTDSWDFTDIATFAPDWYEFGFSGTLNLTVGAEYDIVLQFADTTINYGGGNYVSWGRDADSGDPNSPLNSIAYYWTGASFEWVEGSGLTDIAHFFYGWDGAADATPTPTAYPTYDPNSDTEQLYADLVAFLTPLLVMILPALLLWWLGGKGKWPLLIGLAIGTGLGYVFVSGFPIWLVFLVAIGIIGMAYSDVSSGNGMT